MDNKMMEFIKSITDYSDATILHLYQTWLNAKSSNPKEPETVHGNEAEKIGCDVCGCHPSVIYKTQYGTFCVAHVKY